MEKVAQASGEIEKLTTTKEPGEPQEVVVKRSALAEAFVTQSPEFVGQRDGHVDPALFSSGLRRGLSRQNRRRSIPGLADKKRAVSMVREIEVADLALPPHHHADQHRARHRGRDDGAFPGPAQPDHVGRMVAMLNFHSVPGALTGIICMTLGAVLSFDSLGYAMVFPASYLLIAILEGNFITPLVLGRSLTLNPGGHPDRAGVLGLDVGNFRDDPRRANPGDVQDILRSHRADVADWRVHELMKRSQRLYLSLTQ